MERLQCKHTASVQNIVASGIGGEGHGLEMLWSYSDIEMVLRSMDPPLHSIQSTLLVPVTAKASTGDFMGFSQCLALVRI